MGQENGRAARALEVFRGLDTPELRAQMDVIVEDRHAPRIRGGLLGFPGRHGVRGRARGAPAQGAVHLLESPAHILFQPSCKERQKNSAEPFTLHEPRGARIQRREFEDVFPVEETSDTQVAQPAELSVRNDDLHRRTESHRAGTGRAELHLETGSDGWLSLNRPNERVPFRVRSEVHQDVPDAFDWRVDLRLGLEFQHRLAKEPGRFQLFRDLLDRLFDVLWLPGARAHELAAPKEENDHLRHVDSIDEPGELLRFVFHLLESEGNRDCVQIDFRAQVRRGDDVLDLDLQVLLATDGGGLDLLRDDFNRLLHVLEALRPRADDLAAPEQEGRGLRLLEAVDQSGELLGLVLRASEGEGDRLEVELLPKGGRSDHVLNFDFSHHITSELSGGPMEPAGARHGWGGK